MIYQDNTIRLAAPGGRGEAFTKLLRIPDVQMIYVSALACTRHRSIDFVQMQRARRLSFLLFSEVDMVTGDYIEKTRQACAKIAAERSPSGIILLAGCQSALLSTDYKLLSEEIGQEIGIPVRVHDGCRLCGLDDEEGGVSAIDRLLYAFLQPAEKSAAPSVNILGCAAVDERGELFDALRAAGVGEIRTLSGCKSFADYQDMARAHVNIALTPQEAEIAAELEETLGIPWVCLGGIYSADALAEGYRKLGELLHTSIDVAAWQSRYQEALADAKAAVGDAPISVQGDGTLARWLIEQGFAVKSLQLNPHQGLTPEQRAWFGENAPSLRLEEPKRGGQGGPGGPGGRQGGPGGRPEGKRPGGKPGGEAVPTGWQGAVSVLHTLKRMAGGARHE